MKLSTAILFGMETLRFVPGDPNSDILGAAANAVKIPRVGKTAESIDSRYKEILDRWPWLAKQVAVQDTDCYQTLLIDITRRFDQQVCTGKLSLNDLLMYVRMIEPECGECCDYMCTCNRGDEAIRRLEDQIYSQSQINHTLCSSVQTSIDGPKTPFPVTVLSSTSLDATFEREKPIKQADPLSSPKSLISNRPSPSTGPTGFTDALANVFERSQIALWKVRNHWIEYFLTTLIIADIGMAVIGGADLAGRKSSLCLNISAVITVCLASLLVAYVVAIFGQVLWTARNREAWQELSSGVLSPFPKRRRDFGIFLVCLVIVAIAIFKLFL